MPLFCPPPTLPRLTLPGAPHLAPRAHARRALPDADADRVAAPVPRRTIASNLLIPGKV